MLSKQGYLNAGVKGPWLPHVMFFVPEIDPRALGSGFGDDVPLDAHEEKIGRYTTVDVPVGSWSDGTSASEAFKKVFWSGDLGGNGPLRSDHNAFADHGSEPI